VEKNGQPKELHMNRRLRGGEKRLEVKSSKRPRQYTTTLGLSSLGQWNSHCTTASVYNDAFRYLGDAE
jgi:hypothetical protein